MIVAVKSKKVYNYKKATIELIFSFHSEVQYGIMYAEIEKLWSQLDNTEATLAHTTFNYDWEYATKK